MQPKTSINLLKDKKIAIVGGGPGGLTLARLLQLKGAEVNVYERDKSQSSRVQGAIVDLHFDTGLKAIAAAGLTERFKTSYMPGADRFRLLDTNANILADENNQGVRPTFGDEDFRPEIDRGALRDLLISSLLPDTVIWDRQFAGMHLTADQWQLEFKNGTSAVADIVIGADGYRSGIRNFLTDVKARYSGAMIIQGEIEQPETACPMMYDLVNQANMMAMGRAGSIVAQPRGDGGLTFYAVSLYPEDWGRTNGIDFNNAEAVRVYLKNHFSGWNPVFFSLFDACEDFALRPLNYFPLDQRWETQHNLTLIGDAAHLMPPNGEGVNLAMLDALELSECLTNPAFKNTKEALFAFEKRMFERTAPICRETVESISDLAAPSEESVQQFIAMFSQGDNQKPASSSNLPNELNAH